MNQLLNHTTPETAYVVQDYPYGFRLRCKIRYWVETTKHGQRFVSQTTNPKRPGEVWNKPKASTYSRVVVLYLDDQQHVQQAALSPYSSFEEVLEFAKRWALDPYQRGVVDTWLAAHQRHAFAKAAAEAERKATESAQ